MKRYIKINEVTSKPPKSDSFRVKGKLEPTRILWRIDKPHPDYKLVNPKFRDYAYGVFDVGPQIMVDDKLTNVVESSNIESEKLKYEKILDEKALSLGCVKESNLVYYFETGVRKKTRHYYNFSWKIEPTYELEFVYNQCKDKNGEPFSEIKVRGDLDKIKELSELQTYWLVPQLSKVKV